ncbi:FlgD immunoglobulin-like domain containing protein [Breoghania sp. L-A4]|uniref:flagellar hook assembly protein FlgD n=1 Tax=Breoghania sp. L-A4 TaxID=2304600 RepID=UPI000E35A3EA|nr:FlgD immunoglobulin-like domain containing protein [Breoghania sp. L-A4]AXS41582.1 flagellar biosynthesis protein FlgD [Breoghania sp. L-A4]
MTISTVSSAAATATTTSSTSTSSLGLTSNDFLTLMLEQIQNQNPLDPTDTDSYMEQLVSYGSYDTLNSINDQITSLTTSMESMISNTGLGYVGKTVEANGNTNTLTDGSATYGYSLDEDASSVSISILDESGATVWTGSGETEAGSHSFVWDGTTTDGTQLEDGGNYTIAVEALDANGDSITGSTTVTGVVTGIDVENDESVLTLGDSTISIDDVISIKA